MKNGMQLWNNFCLAVTCCLLVLLVLSLAARTKAQNDGANLVLRKQVNQERVAPGRYTTYTVWVENRGPRPATSLRISDVLPEEVAFVRLEGDNRQGCSYIQQTHTVLCMYPSLRAGQTLAPLTIVVQSPAVPHAEFFNTVVVTSDTHDPHRDDNSAIFRTLVQAIE